MIGTAATASTAVTAPAMERDRGTVWISATHSTIASRTTRREVPMSRCHGVPVSPGLAVGPVRLLSAPPREPSASIPPLPEPQRARDAQRIPAAAAEVAQDLHERASRAEGPAAGILTASAVMATDPVLLGDAQERVRRSGTAAERAIWEAAAQIADELIALGGPVAERAADVRDIAHRIIAVLRGEPMPGLPTADEPYVLVARDLAPADTAELDPTQVLALVTAEGGPLSHTAILARRLRLPAVVAAPGVLDLPEGTRVHVDGSTGTISTEITAAQEQRAALALRERPSAPSYPGGGVRCVDGTRVLLHANIGSLAEAREAVAAGADGVGLLRTEFLFLDREHAPDIAEQTACYREILELFPGRPVVVRTLDAGADKPLPFLSGPAEPNPALGVRGWRTTAARPEVLTDQLDAIAAAASASSAQVHVIAPMITTADEAAQFTAQCRARGLVSTGIMVETPAAALQAEQLLACCDLASIGTNDLTQYTTAADRQLGTLAALVDPWQPAVLRLIQATCAGGAATRIPIGVCGEAAADPLLAPVLIGLGADSLSMTPSALGPVAHALGRLSRAQMRDLAARALSAPDAAQARAVARQALP